MKDITDMLAKRGMDKLRGTLIKRFLMSDMYCSYGNSKETQT